MSQFAGKVALITGGNAGIGRAAAIEFAKQGAKVVVSGRRETEGHDAIAEIKASGGEAIFVKADVSKAQRCQSDDRTDAGDIRPARLCLQQRRRRAGADSAPRSDRRDLRPDYGHQRQRRLAVAKARDSGDAEDRRRGHRQQLFRRGTGRLCRGSGLRSPANTPSSG